MSSQPSTDAIWTRLSDDLRRFIRRRVSDDHVADDLLQESFVRVHRNLAALHDTERLTAWVYRIARNVIHDHHRQAARATLALSDDPVEEAEDRLGCLRSRAAGWLEEMVRQLPRGTDGSRTLGGAVRSAALAARRTARSRPRPRLVGPPARWSAASWFALQGHDTVRTILRGQGLFQVSGTWPFPCPIPATGRTPAKETAALRNWFFLAP
jgi:RNA polymerase sigma factor (sigma-70 family)